MKRLNPIVSRTALRLSKLRVSLCVRGVVAHLFSLCAIHSSSFSHPSSTLTHRLHTRKFISFEAASLGSCPFVLGCFNAQPAHTARSPSTSLGAVPSREEPLPFTQTLPIEPSSLLVHYYSTQPRVSSLSPRAKYPRHMDFGQIIHCPVPAGPNCRLLQRDRASYNFLQTRPGRRTHTSHCSKIHVSSITCARQAGRWSKDQNPRYHDHSQTVQRCSLETVRKR